MAQSNVINEEVSEAVSQFNGTFAETHVGPQYSISAFAQGHGGAPDMRKVKANNGQIHFVARFPDGTAAVLSKKLNNEILGNQANHVKTELKSSEISIQRWRDLEDDTRTGFSMFRNNVGEEVDDVVFE